MNAVNILNMKFTVLLSFLAVCFCGVASAETPSDDLWKRALPGADYEFPRDHSAHTDFKTEWWYFTGTLHSTQGKEYGYELTFFRQGMLPPPVRADRSRLAPENRSRFVQQDFKFAHFAVSDLSGRKFQFTQKINRGAFGDAGFAGPVSQAVQSPPRPDPLAWIDDWTLQPQPDGSWKIAAQVKLPTPMSIDLTVLPTKAPVIEGTDGISQKAAGDGNASYYYSYTRLKTSGKLAVGDGQPQSVVGESWFDHEWASNQLAAEQVGWDWFCLQFDDQTELMLYAMRRRDGTVDPVSSGTLVAADGKVEHLKFGEFKLKPLRTWRSPQTGAIYPLAWKVEIPSRRLDFSLESRLDTQELVLPPVSYWEGAIRVNGHRGDKALGGHGYMELTGYAGALKGLQGPQTQSASNLRGVPQ